MKVSESAGQAFNPRVVGPFTIEGHFYPQHRLPKENVKRLLDRRINRYREKVNNKEPSKWYEYDKQYADDPALLTEQVEGEGFFSEGKSPDAYTNAEVLALYQTVASTILSRPDCCSIANLHIWANWRGRRQRVAWINIDDISHDWYSTFEQCSWRPYYIEHDTSPATNMWSLDGNVTQS